MSPFGNGREYQYLHHSVEMELMMARQYSNGDLPFLNTLLDRMSLWKVNDEEVMKVLSKVVKSGEGET